MTRYLLLDLDNTLYPASSGLAAEIGRRMSRFVATLLGIGVEEADSLRKRSVGPYGTTLMWLRAEHAFDDTEAFLEATHPARLDELIWPDRRVKEVLSTLEMPMAILTNSPIEHARRVLRRLDLDGNFDRVYDIRFNGFAGKPNPSAYEKVLEDLGWDAAEVLFVDDMPSYVEGFVALGGRSALVDESGRYAETHPHLQRIPSVLDLPGLLSN